MKRLGLLFCLITNVIMAQSDFMGSCRFGEGHDIESSTMLSKLLLKDSSGYYMIRNKKHGKKQSRIEHYSLDLEFTHSGKIKSKRIKHNNILMLNGKMYQFFTRQEYGANAKNVNILCARLIDIESLKPLKDEIELLRSIGQYEGVYNSSPFEITISPNGSKVLVHTKYTKVHGVPYKMDLHAFSDELDLLFTKEMDFKYTGNDWFIHNLLIDDLGNTYLVYQNGTTSTLIPKKADAYLWTYELSKQEENTQLLDKGSFAGLRVMPYKGIGICIFGVGLEYRGVVLHTVKKESKDLVSREIILDLPEIWSSLFAPQRNLQRAEKIDYNARFNVIFNDKDELQLVMEELTIHVDYHNSHSGFSKTVTYSYGDIHIIKANLDGNILWARQIARIGITRSKNYCPYFSYSCVITETGISILYNDNSKNEDKVNLDKLNRFTMSSRPMYVKVDVDENGLMTRETITMDRRSLKLFDISSDLGFFEEGFLLLKGSSKELLFRL